MRKKLPENRLNRTVWLWLGFLNVAIAVLGAVLPLLPTTVFLLMAAYCFSRSSKKWHDWLMSHRIFGPIIKDWNENGVISRRSKVFAGVSMLTIIIISVILKFDMRVIALQIICLNAVFLFLVTRPETRR